jgi:alpha-L-fucosidase
MASIPRWVAISVVLVAFCMVTGAGTYEADWVSLEKHEPAPEWFRDAKFGIYMHWGVYSVPAFGSEWYPRNMHMKGSAETKHHQKTYGDPSEFGYHDFVPQFKAEHFDPVEWAALFAQSGAQYAGLVVEHHDGFAMWDSALTPWNAADKGPKRDITGELAKAIRGQDMRFVATFHHARNNQHRVNVDGKLQWEGHYPRVEGWPTVSEDPALRMLYGNLPRNVFLELWLNKLEEVIDQYQPDLIWFDSWLDEIPETYHTAFLSYYLNDAAARDKEVVVTVKQRDLPLEVAVEDFEKGRATEITAYPFLTDDTISYGSWCYTENLRIKPLKEVVYSFIDIVSKNGQLLLNISPKADGTIPQKQRDVLLGFGAWLERNGEAIYGTRPYTVFGEGPTRMKKGGHFVGRVKYTGKDIRFTRKGDAIYVIVLGTPRSTLSIESLGAVKAAGLEVRSVELVATGEALEWSRKAEALVVHVSRDKADAVSTAIKITVTGLK